MAAKPNKPAPAKTTDSALASAAGKAEITALFHASVEELRLGPGGAGWRHNEGKRAAAGERADFFRALLTLLP